MVRRSGVQIHAGGVALLPQSGDEDLLQDDPFAGPGYSRAVAEILQNIRKRSHVWNGMIEFGYGRAGGMSM